MWEQAGLAHFIFSLPPTIKTRCRQLPQRRHLVFQHLSCSLHSFTPLVSTPSPAPHHGSPSQPTTRPASQVTLSLLQPPPSSFQRLAPRSATQHSHRPRSRRPYPRVLPHSSFQLRPATLDHRSTPHPSTTQQRPPCAATSTSSSSAPTFTTSSSCRSPRAPWSDQPSSAAAR